MPPLAERRAMTREAMAKEMDLLLRRNVGCGHCTQHCYRHMRPLLDRLHQYRADLRSLAPDAQDRELLWVLDIMRRPAGAAPHRAGRSRSPSVESIVTSVDEP